MKKLIVSIALFAFISAMAVPVVMAKVPKAGMMQQDKKAAETKAFDTKGDKKCDKSCTKSCCKDKDKDKSAAPTEKK